MKQTRLNNRAVIRLSATDDNEDIREFLQGLVTQDMNLVQPAAPQWGALLSAQGKLLFDFFLWVDGDDILIDCEADVTDALTKRLKLYRLRRKIEIAVDERLAVHWHPTEPGQKGAYIPGVKPGLNCSSDLLAADPRLTELGYRWLAASKESESADAAYLAHRLKYGVTEGQAELGSDKTLWLECNAAELNGVSFTKGCYVGQENTARMNYRQKVNRRMVVVPIALMDEKRQRSVYEGLGVSVEHRRVDNLGGLDLPDWLEAGLVGGQFQREIAWD